MYSIYHPSIIGAFFKELRINHHYTNSQLAQLTHYSTGSISLIENNEKPLEPEKIKLFLSFFQLPAIYLDNLINYLDKDFQTLIHAFIYLDEDELHKIKDLLNNHLDPYKETTLAIALDLATLMTQLFLDKSVKPSLIKKIQSHIHYFTPLIQGIAHLFIGQYAYENNLYDLSEQNLLQARQLIPETHYYIQLLNYTYSRYFIRKGDILNAWKYIQLTTHSLTQFQNYRRLVNINILTALEYTHIQEYNKAISIYQTTLEMAIKQNMDFEIGNIYYNMALIEILRQRFSKSKSYLQAVPDGQKNDTYYRTCTYVLIRCREEKTAIDYCKKGLEVAKSGQQRSELKIFLQYLENRDGRKLCNQLAQLYDRLSSRISIDDQEIMLNMIIQLCKEFKLYKKAVSFYDHLYHLRAR